MVCSDTYSETGRFCQKSVILPLFRNEIKVTGETELFDKETLGKTPQGGSISTYKELCSLASDLNNPHLVYKFLHLANHHSLWNSKKVSEPALYTCCSYCVKTVSVCVCRVLRLGSPL